MRVRWDEINGLLTVLLVLAGLGCLVTAAYQVSPILGIAVVGVVCLVLARVLDTSEAPSDEVPDSPAGLDARGTYANGVRR